MTDSQTGHHKSSRKKSFSLKALLLLVTLVALGIIGKQQWDKYQNRKMLVDWIRQCEIGLPSPNIGLPSPKPNIQSVIAHVQCPNTSLSKEQVLAVLVDGAMNLKDSYHRLYCVKLLAEQYPNDAKEPFIWIALHSRNEKVQAATINLISLCRDTNALSRLEPLLKKNIPDSTRAAILDCIGFTRFPAYQFETSHPPWSSIIDVSHHSAMLNTKPRILIRDFFTANAPVQEAKTAVPKKPVIDDKPPQDYTQFFYFDGQKYPLLKDEQFPERYQPLLRTQMLSSKSPEVRQAAARGLLHWPHDSYRLRIAEWGVWINVNGKFHLAESVAEEIPAFVHTTGDDLSSFAERLAAPMITTKPIMHISVDRPMVVDIEVRIERGRTWFGYPVPDDYSVAEWTENPSLMEILKQHSALPSIWEGYPWLLPESRQRIFFDLSLIHI